MSDQQTEPDARDISGEKQSPRTTPRDSGENTSPNKKSPRDKDSPRKDIGHARSSPRDNANTQNDAQMSPSLSPRSTKTSPRESKPIIHHPKSSPRDQSENDVTTKTETTQTQKPPMSLMSSLRKAHLTIEREDSIDFADAVIEQAGRDHQPLRVSAGDTATPLAQRLQSIEDDKESLANDMKKNLAATITTTTTPTKHLDSKNKDAPPLNATAVGVMSAPFSSEEEPKFLPKPSEEVDLDDDVNALLGLVSKTKEKKPISDKYLKMLEKSKTKQPTTTTSSHRRPHKSKYNITSEASRISQILNTGEDTRWANPRSTVQFKSQYEEMMFRSMQKVMVNKKNGKKKAADSKNNKNTFDRLSTVKKQDSSLFYIQNESGRKYASFNGK
jgi:hypothetical protein